MAATNTFSPTFDLSRTTIAPPPQLIRIGRISMKINVHCSRSDFAIVEPPSCIFVGPIETASKETLEALYRQARDAYYSGKPLILDDMFDKVELKLRRYGSKSVVKYPRCSLRKQSTYADAEEDPSQFFALASVWMLFLAFGSLAFLVPVFYTIGLAYQGVFNSRFPSNGTTSALDIIAMMNKFLFIAVGSVIAYPIASASVGALQGLWKNDLVALKGACPSCGEEIDPIILPIEQTVTYVNAPSSSDPKLSNAFQVPVKDGSMVAFTCSEDGDQIDVKDDVGS
ncbi:hypothetical protein GIB67_034046 [Kingdonia uniflora]|uniref:Uncharacterized protein n=1 Tax=Kingdonia uniflora TaxID=39325 RepID=A0A7J7M649_9MAGN|nr:hypothetical protein GIB67_034046 [Kingdonia uniflora]